MADLNAVRNVIRSYLAENNVTDLDIATIGLVSKKLLKAGYGEITIGQYMEILEEEFQDSQQSSEA